MPYLGNPPAEAYTSTVKDSFSGDGSTTAFTLSQPSTTNDLRVVVENVIQDPTVAYSVSGTTLTFTSAPPSGTNNVYAVNLGPAVQTVVPPDGVTVTDLNAYADGAVAFTANRATSDGDIIDLQKDGTSVGAISSVNSASIIVYGDTGIRFGGDGYLPVDSSGSLTDNAADFGNGSYRYKDLYLGGGVYVGGTGSANYLDDYEFGTWSPRLRGVTTEPGSLLIGEGRYVKIGDFVNAWFSFENQNTTGYAGGVQVDQLPFTVTTQRFVTGSLGSYNAVTWTNNLIGELPASSTTCGFMDIRSGTSWTEANHSTGTVRYLWGNLSYKVS